MTKNIDSARIKRQRKTPDLFPSFIRVVSLRNYVHNTKFADSELQYEKRILGIPFKKHMYFLKKIAKIFLIFSISSLAILFI